MLYGRLVHVGETFNRFPDLGLNCTNMRWAAALCPGPLGSYSAPRGPLAVIRGWGGRARLWIIVQGPSSS